MEVAQIPSHGQAGPTVATPLWIHLHLKDPTSVTHFSHVFAPSPPPDATLCRAHSTMRRRRGNGPDYAGALRRAQEATVSSLVAGAVTEAYAAQAAALHNPAGSARTFLGEAALPAVRALNRAGTPALQPGMHRVVNAVRLGLVGPEAALYGYWME